MTYISSTNNEDVQEQNISKHNCEGMSLDVSRPSDSTYGMEQILVKYAYDLFLQKGSNLNKALVGLQPRLLNHVGESVFTDCDSDVSVIQEITMAFNDAPQPTVSCETEKEFDIETDCYPMKGRAKVYYTPSEQADQTDEELIIETMSKAVKSAMENNVLVTDTIIAVHFIGERDSFSEGSLGDPDRASWIDTNKGWVAGVAVVLVAVIMICICIKRRKKKASEKKVGANERKTNEKVASEEEASEKEESAEC